MARVSQSLLRLEGACIALRSEAAKILRHCCSTAKHKYRGQIIKPAVDNDDGERELPNIPKEVRMSTYVTKKNSWKGTVIPRKTETNLSTVNWTPTDNNRKWARLSSMIQRHSSLKGLSTEDRSRKIKSIYSEIHQRLDKLELLDGNAIMEIVDRHSKLP